MKKKTTTFWIVLLAIFIWLPATSEAQKDKSHAHEHHTCQFDDQQAAFWKAHPEAYQEHLQESAVQKALVNHLKYASLKATSADPDKYIVPIVFHVFGTFQSNKEVTFELIENALQKVNEDFAGQSPGQDDIHSRFEDIVDLLPIEFRLAQIDPNGHICSGVTFNPVEKGFGNGSGYDALIQKYAWDNTKYMNVYIMNDLYDDGDYYNSGVSWYPNTWMTDNNLARTVYNGAYVGDNTDENFRRILTHEFGHFFNLAHTFSGGCPEENGGDHCDDTPPADRSKMAVDDLNCEGFYTNTQNFMNYTNDYQMYTQDQVLRMRAAMQHPARITLWQDTNLEATGVNDGFDAGKAVVYGSYMFEEAFVNDGTISTQLKAKLIGGAEFADATFAAETHYKVLNLPDGLSATINRLNSTEATISLTGSASQHETMHSVHNLTIEFMQGAFTSPLEEIKNRSINSFSIEFKDVYTKYAYPKTNFKTYAGITNVSIANVNHTTPVEYMNSYLNNQVAIVTAGQTVEMSITLNQFDTGEQDYYIIHGWLDTNGDFVFNADEAIIDHTMQFTQADADGNYTFTQEITIPEDIVTDQITGLRLIANFKTNSSALNGYDPYGTYESGELEDYGILVKPVVTEATPGFIISNPEILIKHNVKIDDYSNAPSDDPITQWNWTFDGGIPNTFAGQNPPAIYYELPGSYDVSLEVTTQSGASQTKSLEDAITVTETYCQPETQYAVYGGITHVQLGTIDNTTENRAMYNSFRDTHSASLKIGDQVPFSVTLDAGNSGANDNLGVALWIDWNHNSEFEITERSFYQMVNVANFTDGSYTLSESVIVPIDAVQEATLARVMVYYAGDDGTFEATACSTVESGEIEDYAVIIEAGTVTATVDFEAETITPNTNYPILFSNKSKSLASDPIQSWNWSFEGGQPATSNEKEPSVSWSEDGSFEVSLTIVTQSGERYTLKKDAYITVAYAVCEVEQEWGTKYGHIDRIQIGTIDYSTPAEDVPAYTNLINNQIVQAPLNGTIPFTVTCSKGECGDRDGIGFKVFLDADRNGFTDADLVMKDWFAAKSTDDLHTFNGEISLPDNYVGNKTVALRFVAYNRGYDGTEWYNPSPCDKLDSGTGIDLGISFGTTTSSHAPTSTNNLTMYPNPVTSELTIETAQEAILQVHMFDISGHEILTQDGQQSQSIQINVEQLTNGFYLVKVITEENEYIMKVHKQ